VNADVNWAVVIGSDHDDIDTTTAQGNTSGSTRRRKYLTNKQRENI